MPVTYLDVKRTLSEARSDNKLDSHKMQPNLVGGMAWLMDHCTGSMQRLTGSLAHWLNSSLAQWLTGSLAHCIGSLAHQALGKRRKPNTIVASLLSNCRSPDFKKSNGSNKKIWRGSIIRVLFVRWVQRWAHLGITASSHSK